MNGGTEKRLPDEQAKARDFSTNSGICHGIITEKPTHSNRRDYLGVPSILQNRL
jgi:hypothetical protein